MSWVTPLTASANTVLNASQWNSSVRDNLNETVPAKATAANSVIVTAGTGSIAARTVDYDIIDATATTTSTSYTDLPDEVGPLVTVTSGPLAIVWISGQLNNSSTTNSLLSYAVTGATTDAAADNRAVECDGNIATAEFNRWGVTALQTTTPGVNVFTVKYRVSGASTGTFAKRRINVMPL